MTDQAHIDLLNLVEITIRQNSKASLALLMEKLKDGTIPREAVHAALQSFEGPYYETLANAYSQVLGTDFGVQQIKALPVSGLALSTHLYGFQRQLNNQVVGIIQRHAQGMQDSRKLALDIYEGYGFKDKEALNLDPRNPKLPKYLRELTADQNLKAQLQRLIARGQAETLKTGAFKAAYIQAIDALDKGAGQDRLKRVLDVAYQERMRYFANRIAQTELHRVHSDKVAREIMAESELTVVQIRMSGTHPKLDICDYHAKLDKYGLGAGCYPKALAPKPGFHPFCRCVLVRRWDLDAADAKERKKAEQAFLIEAGDKDGAKMMGSAERYFRAKHGRPVAEILNAGKDTMYHLSRVGDVVPDNGGMKKDKTIRASLASHEFTQFFHASNKSPERFAVSYLTKEDRALFGCRSDVLWLSRQSLDEHKARHPEVTANDYRTIPDIVRDGQVWAGHAPRRYLLLWIGGEPYRAAIKTDKQGEEAWFLSLVISGKQKPPKGAVRVR